MKPRTRATLGLLAALAISPLCATQNPAISLTPLTSIRTGIFDGSAAEIVAHDPESQRLFIVNGADDKIDVADISDPENVQILNSIDVSGKGGPNSVAVKNGLVAVAVQGSSPRERGTIRFFTSDGAFIRQVTVGYHPDMVTYSPDGRTGGIMIYDISNPYSPNFVTYQTQRNFAGDPESDTAGDLAPEGLTFIPASESPNGSALLVVAYEVSGSTTIFEINQAQTEAFAEAKQ